MKVGFFSYANTFARKHKTAQKPSGTLREVGALNTSIEAFRNTPTEPRHWRRHLISGQVGCGRVPKEIRQPRGELQRGVQRHA